MQNKNTPTEGQNSNKLEAESALRDAACCASFTPGPWKADGYYVRQSGQRGTRMIADVCYTGPHHTPPEEYPKSCRLADEANARLIAAAPLMLEAINYVLDHPVTFVDNTVAAMLEAARDAAILHNA
jgi:hypothetical protein